MALAAVTLRTTWQASVKTLTIFFLTVRLSAIASTLISNIGLRLAEASGLLDNIGFGLYVAASTADALLCAQLSRCKTLAV